MDLYDPDEGAIPRGTAFVALLSQRDLSIQIPINFVTAPGVSLTAACFPDRRYEDTVAAKCFSNLLAIGFRRLEVDIYWDVSRRVWSLCPVQLGSADSFFTTTTIDRHVVKQNSAASLVSGQLTGPDSVLAVGAALTRVDHSTSKVRRATNPLASDAPGAAASSMSSTSLSSVSTSATLLASLGTRPVSAASTSVTARPVGEGSTLIAAGPYACTSTVNFEIITTILSSYFRNTRTDLNATMKYLVLNVHAAVPASDPIGSARQPDAHALPRGSDFLSSIVASNNSVYAYTFTEFLNQRMNLNASGSWYTGARTGQPDATYFQVNHPNNHASSPDGWPSESFIELQKAKRLLVGFGTVDPQMEGYNFSVDAATIFAPGYLATAPDVVTDSAGALANGCFFQENEYAVSSVNNSWAIYNQAVTAKDLVKPQAMNLMNCGISPILSETLDGVSAAQDYGPYQTYAHVNNWAWADGEPQDASMDSTADNDYQNHRCAALNATRGRWQASDCTQSHYPACRVNHQPYQWRIGGQKGIYSKVDDECNGDSDFGVPRTALENTYLVSTWRSYLADPPAELNPSTPSDTDTLLWVNFNSLDTNLCWVVGQNATCPYGSETSSDRHRKILVPTVAAVIVFVLVVLTVFVKCAANRRRSKRRRRKEDDGWDYGGLPS